ncbi:MAG: hypothetical protein RIB60_06055 [Phycisphaerales bacterium]
MSGTETDVWRKGYVEGIKAGRDEFEDNARLSVALAIINADPSAATNTRDLVQAVDDIARSCGLSKLSGIEGLVKEIKDRGGQG